MAGISSFLTIILILMVLYVVAVIIIWSVFRSSRIQCETDEHPLCYTFVCPNNAPASRLDSNGKRQLSGDGLIPSS